MTVEEFIGTLESSDRLRIIEGKAEVYVAGKCKERLQGGLYRI